MSSTEHKCVFCEHIFKSKSSLHFHVINAKYCKIIQNEIIENKKNGEADPKFDSTFVCKSCDTLFLKSEHLDIHHNKCKVRLQLEADKNKAKLQKIEIEKCTSQYAQMCATKDLKIEFLERENKRLNEMIEEYRSREIKYQNMFLKNDNFVLPQQPITTQTVAPSVVEQSIVTVNDNTKNFKLDAKLKDLLIPLSLTKDIIKDKYADLYTIENFLDGNEGLLRWLLGFIYSEKEKKYMFVCTDTSRLTLCYYDKTKNEYCRDYSGKYFVELVYNSVYDRVKYVYSQYNEKFNNIIEPKIVDGEISKEDECKLKEISEEQDMLCKRKQDFFSLKDKPNVFLKLYIAKTK